MTECERRIASLKPGVDYRRGTRRPYRACPADFREVYLRLGSDRAIEEHYRVHWRAIARWIEEAGGDELRADRSAITGQPPRPYNRTHLPTYTEVLASIMTAPSEGSHGNAA